MIRSTTRPETTRTVATFASLITLLACGGAESGEDPPTYGGMLAPTSPNTPAAPDGPDGMPLGTTPGESTQGEIPLNGTSPGELGAPPVMTPASTGMPPAPQPDPVTGLPGVGSVEDSGTACPRPALPPANQLTPFATHADPFLMADGTRITTKAQWTCRRAEIKAQVEEYESGPKPAVDKANVSGQLNGNQLTVGVSEAGRSVSFSITINRPTDAPAGPIPLLIGVGGSSLDNSVFSQNGVATANLDNNGMGAQAGGGSRGTGTFFDLYGNTHTASSMVAWAWGVSRVIDALENTPAANIDPQRVAVTGCSRNGKGALTAGAFDERIVLTIPQESGAGGSASWRVAQLQSSQGENVQTLSSAAGEQPWFRANFGQNFGGNNVTRLPFDHHTVMGMVAPRALLVIDNEIDWLGIDSTFTGGSIANQIWQAFGLADHMGYWQTTGHTHCAYPASQRAILDAYVKKFLVGGGTDDTSVLRGDAAQADLDQWLQWTPPALE
ncbi:MAG: dockerin-like protein [Deltaproteobacteria bacterium]